MSNLKWNLHEASGFTVTFLEHSLASFLWSKSVQKKNTIHFIFFLTVIFNLVRNLARVSSKEQEQTLYHCQKTQSMLCECQIILIPNVTLTWHFLVITCTIFLHCYKACSYTTALFHSYIALVCLDIIQVRNRGEF